MSQHRPHNQKTGEEGARLKRKVRNSWGQLTQEDGWSVNEELGKCPLLLAAMDTTIQTETSYQI